MNWLSKLIDKIPYKPFIKTEITDKKNIPEGIWVKCEKCGETLYHAELVRNLYVCPKCDNHLRVSARNRISYTIDQSNLPKDPLIEIGSNIVTIDHLKFKDTKKYKDRLVAAKKNTGEEEALIVVEGKISGISVVCSAFDFGFIGGSMGSAVGEKFVLGVETAISKCVPLINFSASGGARMQEGLFSLTQMAKVSAALHKLSDNKLPYISVLTDPTTGGVAASLAMLGDIIIAEPNAIIGFAGRRVIEQTVRQQLPDNFQRSEFLLEHGAIDMIVHRKDMKKMLAGLLAKLV